MKNKLLISVSLSIFLLFCGCVDLQSESSSSSTFSDAEKAFSIKYLSDDECAIIAVDAISTATLEIPTTIGGYTVVGIEGVTEEVLTDKDSENTTHSKITTLIIPETVEYIGEAAFCGMRNLQTLVFNGNSVLTSIGQYAFMNTGLLGTVILPDSVTNIGLYAFAYCESIENVYIGSNAKWLETGFQVDLKNENYAAIEGVLFSKDGEKLHIYPTGAKMTSYTVPSSVVMIASYAFSGNNNLVGIDLKNTSYVDAFAFENCENLTNIKAEALHYAGENAFKNTIWLNSNTDEFVQLGQALIKYQGNSTTVNIENVFSISPYAFVESENIEKIIFKDNLIRTIDDHAFAFNDSLTEVYICNTAQMVYVGYNAFPDTATIYLPDNIYNEYSGNEIWTSQYKGAMTVHETTFTFNSNGGSSCESIQVKYAGNIGELPTPQKAGHQFIGWYTNSDFSGREVRSIDFWDRLDDEIILYAKYE